jgi:hypothetical protein
MNTHAIQLINSQRNIIATGRVTEQNEHFAGDVDLSRMPADMRRTFEEYEEIVNGQMFGLLDEIEDRINLLSLRVVFNEACEAMIEDVQIYPSMSKVSFRVLARQEIENG